LFAIQPSTAAPRSPAGKNIVHCEVPHQAAKRATLGSQHQWPRN
jgi:hypothetical protein